MSESKNININPDQDKKIEVSDPNVAAPSEVSSIAGSVKQNKVYNMLTKISQHNMTLNK